MRRMIGLTLLPTALLVTAVILATGLRAQDADTTKKLKFHFQQVAKPVDPDPTKQDEAARLKSLRKSISEAIALLEKDNLGQFFEKFVDPFWIARAAGSPGGGDIDEAFTKFLVENPDRRKDFTERFLKTLRSSLASEPRWILKGRAASFMTQAHSSHTAEFWVYFEGKWRISPET